MKKRYGLVLGIMLLSAGLSRAAGTFEGEVDYNLTVKDDKGTMDYLIKEKKIRMDIDIKGHASSVIMDMGSKQMFMLMPQQKMVMTMAMPADAQKTKSQVEGKLTKTGNTEVILGKTAEEWVYKSDKGLTSIWAAQGMGIFMGMGNRPNDSNNAWAEAVKKNGLFPLKVVSKDKDGKVVTSMEATKIAPQTLDAGQFEAPSDYHKMDMSGLGARMGAGMSGQ